mgnify:CR=1 FL=1
MSQNNPTTQRNSGRSHKGAESADAKDLSAPLREAKWSRTFIPNATLSDALEHARAAAAELTQPLASAQEAPGQGGESGSSSQASKSHVLQGIAYTTSGAKAIVRIDAAASPLVDSSHERVPLNTVYELRLWQVIAPESSSESPQPDRSASNRESGETANNSESSKAANNSDSNGVLAREIRWLNGSGCAEIIVERLREGEDHDPTVREKAEDDGTNKDNGAKTLHQGCWYRVNKYLQHGADISSEEKLDETDIMRSIEVFVVEPEFSNEEPKFGNTVFADELMTGRWA